MTRAWSRSYPPWSPSFPATVGETKARNSVQQSGTLVSASLQLPLNLPFFYLCK